MWSLTIGPYYFVPIFSVKCTYFLPFFSDTYVRKTCHAPSSPPGTEKSFGKMDHFWIFWAFDTDWLFALSIPFWMAFNIAVSLALRIYDTVVAFEPMEWHQSSAPWVRLSDGSKVSGFITVWSKKENERNCNTKIWENTISWSTYTETYQGQNYLANGLIKL